MYSGSTAVEIDGPQKVMSFVMYGIAEADEPLDIAPGDPLFFSLVEIARPELFVRHFVFEYLIPAYEDLVADGDKGASRCLYAARFHLLHAHQLKSEKVRIAAYER
jgi:hypothetical protein